MDLAAAQGIETCTRIAESLWVDPLLECSDRVECACLKSDRIGSNNVKEACKVVRREPYAVLCPWERRRTSRAQELIQT